MDELISAAQLCINHEFSQVKLLRTALTHSSYANEQEESCEHNERLEFLGDAVLELVISEEAYKRFPTVHEGQLTGVRSLLVKEKSLAELARSIGLERFIFLGRGEDAQGGRERDSLLADTMEAVFGAVFLDGGFEAAKEVILSAFADRWPEITEGPAAKDYKSRLQEATQHILKDRPTYVLSGSSGPEHEKVFEVTATLPDGRTFVAEGPSVKKAEQTAAKLALETLEGSV